MDIKSMKENNINFPKAMGQYLAGRVVIEVTENHRSGDLVYRVGDDYILKVSDNIERLERERAVNDFLTGRLAEKEYLRNPRELIRLLAQAMRMIHEAGKKQMSVHIGIQLFRKNLWG